MENENMKSRIATENEVKEMEKKINTIHQDKVKNNFKNMDTLTSIDQSSTTTQPDSLSSANEEAIRPSDLNTSRIHIGEEGFQDQTQDYIDKNFTHTKTRWKNAFKFLTDLKATDMQKPHGWQKIFRALFYIYPITTGLAVDDFVEAVPVTVDGNVSIQDFIKKREMDKEHIKHTAYEFGYLLLTFYFSYMVFARLYGGRMLEPIQHYVKTGNAGIDQNIERIFHLVFAPCSIFRFILFDGFPKIIKLMGIDSYPTLRFTFIFIICYYFSYFFLGKFAKMFLNVFEYKSNPSIYVLLVAAWVFFLVSNSDKWYATFATTAFFLVSIILLVVSILMAPMAQLLLVVYVVYALVGSPSDIYKALTTLFMKRDDTLFEQVNIQVAQSNLSNTNTIFGGFDQLLYKYAFKYLFFFLMMLFFAFKTIQSAFELNIDTIRMSITTINAYITATMLVIYLAKMLMDKPKLKQEFSIRKTPSSEQDNVADSTMNFSERMREVAYINPAEFNDTQQSQLEIQRQQKALESLNSYLARIRTMNFENVEDQRNGILQLIDKINKNITSLSTITSQFENIELYRGNAT
jgi:hypothetical protein